MSRQEWFPGGMWRDPDCIECDGEGAPCCDPPNHPPPGARAWIRWHLVGPLRCLPETVGQWLRPYDIVTDARRWRWQRPAQCGSSWVASLTDEQRAELIAAIRDQIERGQP